MTYNLNISINDFLLFALMVILLNVTNVVELTPIKTPNSLIYITDTLKKEILIKNPLLKYHSSKSQTI